MKEKTETSQEQKEQSQQELEKPTPFSIIKEKKKDKTQDKLQELIELLQRTQANFENYRKQQEKRIQEIQTIASQDLILQLLPILDNFELALKTTPTNPKDFLKGAEKSEISGTPKNSFKEFLMGIELIHSQLFTVLADAGIKPIKTENQLFDPHHHQALLKINSDKPENTILEELQKGFTLNDQVIRHAKVKVSSGQKPEENQNKITKEETQNDK